MEAWAQQYEWQKGTCKMSNDFHEIRFPTDISYGAQGGPKYDTDIIVTKAGYEHRNLNRPEGLCEYNITYGIKRTKQFAQVLAFYRARKGKTYGFRYRDWSDYRAVNQQIGTANGTTTTFQLIKVYEDDASSDTRTIYKPIEGTVNLYVGEKIQTNNCTVDCTTGKVIFNTAPGTVDNQLPVMADFEFDVPVRFNTDMSGAEYTDFNSLQWSSISLVELLLED